MTATTPTPEALRHRAAARSWARSGEWGFTIASSAVNVTVVAAAGGSVLRILLAGLAPIVLAAMAHLLTKVLQSELVVSGVHWGVALVVAGAVTLIGAGAFILSFDMLRRAAEPDHGQLAWVFPVTLDLAIVVCAGVLAVIAWADEQDQRNSAAVHDVDGAPAPMSTPRPVTATPVTEQLTAPDVQLTTGDDEVITAPTPTAQQGEQQPVTCDDAADDHPAEPAVHQDAQVIAMVSEVGQQEMVTGEQVVGDEQLPTAQLAISEVVSTEQLTTTETAGEQSAGEQEIDPAQEAVVLRERGSSRLAEDDLTDLIARIARGESYSAIAEATGISRNTVRKVAAMVPTEPEPVPVA